MRKSQGLWIVGGLLLLAGLWAWQGMEESDAPASGDLSQLNPSLKGAFINPLAFKNPYPFVPAQCYIETSLGHQNACLFCHNNGLNQIGLGNNNPHAGIVDEADFQLEYAFEAHSPVSPLATVNRWDNTLYPDKLLARALEKGHSPKDWTMADYIAQDNWQAAYDQRPGSPLGWDGGVDAPFRLLAALNPADLPADADGFVRSQGQTVGYFSDAQGAVTGWRAINFMPYGIFTPQSGSVSGIYIRLPAPFMQTAAGAWDLTTYAQNLDLVEKAITDKLEGQTHYLGAAARISITRGAYPKGTEFAHPLHYVDMTQPGTRAKRVKEVRWMYKYLDHDPMTAQADDGAGEALYLNGEQGWIDNGAGWLLSGFIEDAQGDLRPQRGEELAQCIGCHSGFRQTTGENFVSGLSSTVDSSWAMVRKLPGEAGWKEMDYLGYLPPGAEALIAAEVGQSSRPEPKNRKAQIGEFGLFLETVVGASLYGEMPAHLEVFLAQEITQASGYAQDWPALNLAEPIAYEASVKARSALLKTYVARGDYLTGEGRVKGDLLYPPMQASLAGAARYRQVVVTQSYDLGKDVFAQTPVSFKHYRPRALAEKKPDGQVYSWGELILERPVNQDPASEAYHAGNAPTLIEAAKPYPAGVYYPDYLPLVD